MILQNLSKAIREQNYYAVALEFVIVIAGVVIGFQVTAWNADRQDRALEAVYLQRLHEEAVYGLDGILRSVGLHWGERDAAILDVFALLYGDDPADTLSPAQCRAIGQLDSIIAFPFQFPSLQELISSGQLSIIKDASLRAALTDYALMQENSRSLVAYYNAEPIIMGIDFPGLVTSRHTVAEGRIEPRFTCDLQAMRASAGFIAAFNEAAFRFHGYHGGVVREEIDTVAQIHDLLDAALSITHEEAAP